MKTYKTQNFIVAGLVFLAHFFIYADETPNYLQEALRYAKAQIGPLFKICEIRNAETVMGRSYTQYYKVIYGSDRQNTVLVKNPQCIVISMRGEAFEVSSRTCEETSEMTNRRAFEKKDDPATYTVN